MPFHPSKLQIWCQVHQTRLSLHSCQPQKHSCSTTETRYTLISSMMRTRYWSCCDKDVNVSGESWAVVAVWGGLAHLTMTQFEGEISFTGCLLRMSLPDFPFIAMQPLQTTSVCRFFPECKKKDCPFYHPKVTHLIAYILVLDGNLLCYVGVLYKQHFCSSYPQPCRFAAQCKRPGCTFYHPTTTVPPRHALKWTKTQNR